MNNDKKHFVSGTVDPDAAIAGVLRDSYNGYAGAFGWPQATNQFDALEQAAGMRSGIKGLAGSLKTPRMIGRNLRNAGEAIESVYNATDLADAMSPLTGLLDKREKAPPTKFPATGYKPTSQESEELRGLMNAKQTGRLQRGRPDLPQTTAY